MMELLSRPFLQLTVLFALTLVVAAILRKKEPAWSIALIRSAFLGGLLLLLLPWSSFSWQLPSWVTPLFQSSFATPVAAVSDAANESRPATEPTSPLASHPARETEPGPPLLLVIWLGLAIVLLGRILCTLRREKRELARGTEAPPPLDALWKQTCREAGVNPGLIRVLDGATSPRLSLNRTLLIPNLLLEETIPDSTRKHVLRHEAAHLRAGDHFWFPFLAVLTCLLWFHPLAWWLRSRHLVACEEARDAEAARLGGSDDYRSSLAQVALSLLPSSSPSPGLVRKNGRLVARLNRVQETARQSPPLRAVLVSLQSLLLVAIIAFATATPSLPAAQSLESFLGTWRAEDRHERFARQVEVYEWGGEMKLRIWYTVGTGTSLRDATVASFGMTRAQFEGELRERGFVSLDFANSFSESVYSLAVQNDQLAFSLETTYTDDSGRGVREHTSYYVRGKWGDFESTFR